ncbi:MAG TPA: antibiotic biosynthesis monooxygenase [Dehalococcoidia bacterium]|nr:antibiotic biosynthesis monooxygenase [Dehalococcoidia bacterium]
MAVKVLIERHVKKGKEGDLVELLNKLRMELISQPGYVSGELLQNQKDKSIIFALSTWLSELDWKSWEGNPKRLEIESQIEPLLTEPLKLTIATSF